MWAVGDSVRQGEVHGEVTDIRGNTYYYWLENGTCGGCLSHRLEKGYRMARPRKTVEEKKNAAAAKETNGLLEAVKFCKGGFKDGGEAYASHAMIYDGYISTYDGVVMYAHKIDTAMRAAPHYGKLLEALKATDGGPVQVTQLNARQLSIKQQGFRTIIPCIDDLSLISRTAPDPSYPAGSLDSRMREGFEAMKQIANKAGETVMESAVFIGNGYMVACDNHLLGMYWHGLGFPELVVPANFIEAVLRIPKSLVSFGYTPDKSVTFYFDDGSFLRSQLYAEKYPAWQQAMPEHFEGCPPLPEGFFAGLRKIKPFVTGRSHVFLSDDLLHTDTDPEQGTAVDVVGIPNCTNGIDIARVLMLENRITNMDLSHPQKQRFYGENFRGVIATYLDDKPEPEQTVAEGFADYVEQLDAAVEDGTWQPPQPESEPEIDPDPADLAPPVSSGWGTPQV